MTAGRWLVAGTPIDQRYPCRCDAGDCSPAWCPCAARADAEAMPLSCCSRRTTPAQVAEARRAYDARRAAQRARDGG